jgi:hypothetical protein
MKKKITGITILPHDDECLMIVEVRLLWLLKCSYGKIVPKFLSLEEINNHANKLVFNN